MLAVLGALATTAPALAAPPVPAGKPVITGSAQIGQTLTVQGTTWTPDPGLTTTSTYEWQACTGAVCGAGAGTTPTATTYVPGGTDLGRTIQVVETATSTAVPAELGTATSDPTAVVIAALAAPTVAAPTLAGSPVSGQTLTATDGAFGAGNPAVTATRQWYRCPTAAFSTVGATQCTVSPKAGTATATGMTYAVDATDGGSYLAYVVSASNVVGAASNSAITIAPVLANTTAPPIGGEATVGKPIVVNDGAWTGNPTFSYRWQQCSTVCLNIVGSEGKTSYTLKTDDVGKTVRAVVTAASAAGTLEVASAQTATVALGASNVLPRAVDAKATQPGDAFNVTAPAKSTPKASTPGIRQFSPFPVVRVKGVLTASGARVKLLSVTAPKGVSVKVSCSGRGCPKSVSMKRTRTAVTRMTGFERSLRSGVKITVKVSRPGYAGKYTSITIRKGTSPARTDGCLSATGRPMACQGG